MPAPPIPRGYVANIQGILSVLGTTKTHLWPFVESEGVSVSGFTVVNDLIPTDSGGAEALEDDFSPIMHTGGVHSFHFTPNTDHHLNGPDHADLSFGNSTADSAVSFGAWIWPYVVASMAMITKFDSAGNAEEYRFWLNSSSQLELELHDANASATEVATGSTTLVVGRPYFLVAAYDGAQATPDIQLYVNGESDNDGSSTESGTYVAMESLATPLVIGASGVTATPINEFHGRIALPFICGKQLSAEEVLGLYAIYKRLLGNF